MAELIFFLKEKGFIKQILLSHDAGWYSPGEPDGGDFKGFTTISDKLLPLLKKKGISDAEVRQLMVTNPAHAFAICIRRI